MRRRLTGDTDIGLQGDAAEATRTPLPVIEVDDLEAALDAVTLAGGMIVRPIFAFPGGRRFQFLDPERQRDRLREVGARGLGPVQFCIFVPRRKPGSRSRRLSPEPGERRAWTPASAGERFGWMRWPPYATRRGTALPGPGSTRAAGT